MKLRKIRDLFIGQEKQIILYVAGVLLFSLCMLLAYFSLSQVFIFFSSSVTTSPTNTVSSGGSSNYVEAIHLESESTTEKYEFKVDN